MPVRVLGERGAANTFALLDDGSTITLIDSKLTRELGIEGSDMEISLKGISEEEKCFTKCQKVTVNIQTSFGSLTIEHAVTIPDLNLPTQSLSEEIVKLVEKREGIVVESYKNARPRILIGQDNWHLIAPHEIVGIRNTGLAISRSPLGWALHGYAKDSNSGITANIAVRSSHSACVTAQTEIAGEDDKLDELVTQYFTLENLGVCKTYDARP